MHRAIFEHVGEPMLVIERDSGRAIDVNRAARELGVDLDALATRDDVKRALRSAFERARPKTVDVIVTDEEDVDRVLSITASQLDDKHAVISLRDVTAQRALEREVRHHRRVDTLGYLTASIIHDFNNVLTPIMLAAETAERDIEKPARALASVREIRVASQRASGLVRQLHSFIRKEPAKTTRVSVNQTIEGMRGLIDLVTGERVTLELALDASAGDVKVDRDALEHVLLNLAANARDAMPRGGKLTFTTSNVCLDPTSDDAPGDVQGDYVTIAVTDTGTGMSNEVRERLFERFFTTKESGQGLGLGLTAAHRFVSESAGVINVRSEVGRGTTVAVYLPRVDPAERSSESEIAIDRASSSSTRRARPKTHETILVVEDDAPVRRVVRALLEEHGYRVLDAASADDAFRVLAESTDEVDLALIDVVMPETSGVSFAEDLRRKGRVMKVIFMSGHTDRALAEHGLFDSASLLRKAFSPSALLKKVRAALGAPNETPSAPVTARTPTGRIA